MECRRTFCNLSNSDEVQEKEIASCQSQACTSESLSKQGIIITLLFVNSVLEK